MEFHNNFSLILGILRDFNTILEAREHREHHSLAIVPMENFKSWSDHNSLIHLSIVGMQFIGLIEWVVCISQIRSDKVMYKIGWLDMWNNYVCSTLVKICLDHFPNMLEWSNHEQRFITSFRFHKTGNMHDDCINVIKETWQECIYGCPVVVLTTKL